MWFRHRHDARADDMFAAVDKGNVNKWVARRYGTGDDAEYMLTGGYLDDPGAVIARICDQFPDAIGRLGHDGIPVQRRRVSLDDYDNAAYRIARWCYIVNGRDRRCHDRYLDDAASDGTFYEYHTHLRSVPWRNISKLLPLPFLITAAVTAGPFFAVAILSQSAPTALLTFLAVMSSLLCAGSLVDLLSTARRHRTTSVVNDHGESFDDLLSPKPMFDEPRNNLYSKPAGQVTLDDDGDYARTAIGLAPTSYTNRELEATFHERASWSSPVDMVSTERGAIERRVAADEPSAHDVESALSALLPGGVDGNMREAVASLSPTDAGWLYAAIRRLATAPEQTGGEAGGTAGAAPTPTASETGSSVTVAGSPANAIRSTGTPVRG